MLIGCKHQLSASEARKALSSTEPRVRQEGATALQKMYAKDPMSLGDHGEQHWVEQLKKVRGVSNDEAYRILGNVQSRGSEGGGGGANDHIGLDDFWATDLYRELRNNTITGYEPPRRQVVQVYVERPARFTGTWVTYFVNGAVYDSFEVEGGIPRRDREYHDNGQLRSDHLYVDGRREGTVIVHFANGATEWEHTYAKGKLVGVEKWFYRTGTLRQEDHWADDKREGRTTYYSEDGYPTTCIDYRAGVEVERGCFGK
jgi:hypothetical protein